ncbi:MAG: hypothetical protein L3K06_07090 [Thermoplasmata archaeon]|nr:hypothetical protein [Thermoplasmata archaeon]
MKLYSANPHPIDAKVFRGPPIRFQNEEWAIPPAIVTLPPYRLVEVEQHGPAILERYGASGVVRQLPGEDEEATRYRAVELRYDHLCKQLQMYQEQAGAAIRINAPVPRMTPALTQMHAEYTAIKQEVLAKNPLLRELIPARPEPSREQILASELAPFTSPAATPAPDVLAGLP